MDPAQCNRRRRTKFTDEQLSVLEKSFSQGSKYPSPEEIMRLQSKTGLSKEKISVWFQNRRAKDKREKGQDAGSKESTTTDSELETEDERQLNAFHETLEEDSEIDDMGTYSSKTPIDFKLTQSPANISRSTPDYFQAPPCQTISGFHRGNQGIQNRAHETHSMGNPTTLNHHYDYNTPDNATVHRDHFRTHPLNGSEISHSVGPHYSQTEDTQNSQNRQSSDLFHDKSSGYYHEQVGGMRIRQNTTTDDTNVTCSESQSSTPGYIVLTLPGGTIAVESTEGHNKKLDEKRLQENTTRDVKYPSLTSMVTNSPTEIKVAHSVGTVVEDTSKIYRRESQGTCVRTNTSDVNNTVRCTILPSPEETVPAGTRGLNSFTDFHGIISAEDVGSGASVIRDIPTLINAATKTNTLHMDFSKVGRGKIRYTSASSMNIRVSESIDSNTCDNPARATQHPLTAFPAHSEATFNPTQGIPISSNAQAEIKVSHLGTDVASDVSENEKTPSLVAKVHMITSCLDEKPRKRDISETASLDEKPVMEKHISGSDGIVCVKDDFVTVRDSGMDEVGSDEVRLHNKKIKIEEDKTCAVTTGNTDYN